MIFKASHNPSHSVILCVSGMATTSQCLFSCKGCSFTSDSHRAVLHLFQRVLSPFFLHAASICLAQQTTHHIKKKKNHFINSVPCEFFRNFMLSRASWEYLSFIFCLIACEGPALGRLKLFCTGL